MQTNLKTFTITCQISINTLGIVVLGGGDSAVDWALAFDKIAPTSIIHRRDNFRALEHSVNELKASTVTIKTPFVPSQLIGDGNKLTHLEITKVKSNETELLPLDQLFVNYGFKSSVGNLKKWGLELNRHKIIVNSKQETSVAGIYAAGDVTDVSYKQIVIAMGEGAKAALAAFEDRMRGTIYQ